jgi:molybdopterin-guanine dinucleotide biosynthesis protein A
MKGLAVIVLAAGLGTRMKSSLAKVLHPLAGRPMLLHTLDNILPQTGKDGRCWPSGGTGQGYFAAGCFTALQKNS